MIMLGSLLFILGIFTIKLGTNLNNFLTKQGKLKKHIKNCYDLLEIDLMKKNMGEHFF